MPPISPVCLDRRSPYFDGGIDVFALRPDIYLHSRGVFLAPDNSMVSGSRILVADDDADLLEVVSEALTNLGADVTRATTGAELIDKMAEKGPFDLVVTDIAMPWMTGISAMNAARTAGLGMSVVVMTALNDEAIPSRVKALGAALLLHKPFTLTQLESVVTNLLAHRQGQPESNRDLTHSSRG
jgi:CheY-like chemotaxis protein